MRKPRQGVNFGAGVPWRGVSAVADEKLANNVEASMDIRVVAFARARLEFSGHAHFGRSELREVLSYVVKSGPGAGEIRKPTRHGITKAIQRLTDWGVFAPGSWSECIAFPGMSVQNGRKAQGEKPCPGRPSGS